MGFRPQNSLQSKFDHLPPDLESNVISLNFLTIVLVKLIWEGCAFNAWSRSTFQKIGSKWGEMVELEDGYDGLFARKRICIKTSQTENILESFKINVKGKVILGSCNEIFVWYHTFVEVPEKELYSDNESVKINEEANNINNGLGSKAKKDWIKELISKQKVSFLSIQETKKEWGILCAWDVNLFKKDHHTIFDNFMALYGLFALGKFLLCFCSSPFRFFHSWLDFPGFDELVSKSWNSLALDDSNDQGGVFEEILLSRMEVLKQLHDVQSSSSRDIMQKAKIRWAIEGDENSKYFHAIINKKRTNLSVKGIMVDGDWIVDPDLVKQEFRNHFADRFQDPGPRRGCINFPFPKRLSNDQVSELEAPISNDDIHTAV
ncbi:hypothetical protein Tco_0018011 [Tanacetum coccineum]